METTTKKDLKAFRFETRQWLETHCPKSMRTPLKDSADYYWGGSNPTFSSEDQKVWFEKMLEKKWIVPYWDTQYGGGGLSPEENNILVPEDKTTQTKINFDSLELARSRGLILLAMVV